MYSVNFWGSHPDAGNDDCLCGEDFATLEGARAYFADPSLWVFNGGTFLVDDCPYVELASGERSSDGVLTVETIKVRKNPDYRPDCGGGDDWRDEIAREAGMLGGVEAYNEVMGA